MIEQEKHYGRIFPIEVDPVYDIDQHSGELATLRMLQQALPENLCIFHSVDWASIDNKRTHFGEIDFVILSPSGDIVVIEQRMVNLRKQAVSCSALPRLWYWQERV